MPITYVVAYARFSSDNQREESIDAQLRAIRSYCNQKDYVLLDTYVDEARSATTDDRPSFQRMVRDAAAGNFSAVIVHKLDRFSRNRYDSAIYKKQLRDHGVRVESVLEHLDDSPESVILESLLEGMSEYYSKNLAREVRKGQNENALKCRHNGGVPLYGYSVDKDGYYVINEYEAAAVRAIFQLVKTGHSYQEIISIMTERGYRTRSGRKFSYSTIHHMLHNEKYNGTYVYNRTMPQPKGGKRTNASRPDDEILRIPGGMPAIVDMPTFLEVQKIMKRRNNQSAVAAGHAKEVYLLQGLIKCGNCGSPMVGARRKDGRDKKLRVSYECSGRKRKKTNCMMRNVSRDLVESLVIDHLEKYVLSDEAIARAKEILTEEIEKNSKTAPDGLNALKKDLADTNAALDHLIDAIAAGVDALRMKDKIDALEAKRISLEQQIALIESRQHTFDSIQLAGLDAVLSQYRNIRSKDRKEQKEIINKFVKEVLVYDNDDDGSKIILTLYYGDDIILSNGDTLQEGLSPLMVSPTMVFEINISYCRQPKRRK